MPTAENGNSPTGLTASGLLIGPCATLACILEATAPKVGNVHRGADFADMRLEHLLAAAVAIGPAMAAARDKPLGQTILQAVEESRRVTGVNANLGIILLLAPLASVSAATPLELGVERILHQLKPEDAADVYRAIQLANPGGLGEVDEMDVHGEPPGNLLLAMRAAEDRDMVARQWTRSYADVHERLVPWLQRAIGELQLPLPQAVAHVHLQTLAEFPDSLIARKAGLPLAQEIAARAGAVLSAGPPGSEEYEQAIAEFDFYLRSDGNRRNPGTTADLMAAALFAALRDGLIPFPLRFY